MGWPLKSVAAICGPKSVIMVVEQTKFANINEGLKSEKVAH